MHQILMMPTGHLLLAIIHEFIVDIILDQIINDDLPCLNHITNITQQGHIPFGPLWSLNAGTSALNGTRHGNISSNISHWQTIPQLPGLLDIQGAWVSWQISCRFWQLIEVGNYDSLVPQWWCSTEITIPEQVTLNCMYKCCHHHHHQASLSITWWVVSHSRWLSKTFWYQ